MDTSLADELPPLTATELQRSLAATSTMTAAASLAAHLRQQLGAEALRSGTAKLTDELTAAWAIEVLSARTAPSVRAELGAEFRLPLTRLGDTDVYAGAATLPAGTAMRWVYEVDGERVGGGQVELYPTHPDSRVQPGVPTGELLRQPRWRSTVFADTVRDWSLYVPAQYDAAQPAAVMVFQDGVHFYQEFVPTVFDNLIAAGDTTTTLLSSADMGSSCAPAPAYLPFPPTSPPALPASV